MKKERRIGAALAACTLLAGLWLFVQANPLAPGAPTIHAPLTATAGTPFSGDASDAGGAVEVEIWVDGQPVPGLFDDVMDGDENHFDFTLPESLRGKDIEVVAIDTDGNESRQSVHVN